MRKLLPELWRKSGGICALCDKPLDPAAMHIDHIIPRSRGGTDDIANLQTVHQSCNSRKHTMTLEDAVAHIRTTPIGHRAPSTKPIVTLVMDDELLQRIDDFRFAFRYPSRAVALRFLIEAGLDAERHSDATQAHHRATKQRGK